MNMINKMIAKLTSFVADVREHADDEQGDIVQTLIIIGIAVVLGGIVLAGLTPVIQGCLNALAGGGTACFGIAG